MISAVVIARDEEKRIGDCLLSLTWCDEIIVVIDDRTSDQTANIARQYTGNVHLQKWFGYAQQKNFALQKAQHDWILSLDADEQASLALASEIKETLKNPVHNGYYVPFHTFIGNKRLRYGGMQNDWHLRLFKKEFGIFKGKHGGQVHETVSIDNAGYLQHPIIHHTYENNQEFLGKVIEYSSLEARQLVKQGYKLSLFDYFKPLLRFVNIYFKKLGFLDGYMGLVNATYLSYYLLRRNRLISKLKRKARK